MIMMVSQYQKIDTPEISIHYLYANLKIVFNMCKQVVLRCKRNIFFLHFVSFFTLFFDAECFLLLEKCVVFSRVNEYVCESASMRIYVCVSASDSLITL